MTVKTRLWAALALMWAVLALTAASLWWGAARASDLQRGSDEQQELVGELLTLRGDLGSYLQSVGQASLIPVSERAGSLTASRRRLETALARWSDRMRPVEPTAATATQAVAKARLWQLQEAFRGLDTHVVRHLETIASSQDSREVVRLAREFDGQLALILAETRQDAARTGTRIFRLGLQTVSVPLAASGIVVFLLVRLVGQVNGGLQRLLTGTKTLIDGDLDTRLPDMGRDELGRLAEAFNHMAASLQADIHRREVTAQELRESEARIRAILDTVPVGLVICDDTGRIESLNPTASGSLGYAAAALEGKPVMTLLDGQSLSSWEDLAKGPRHPREGEAIGKARRFPVELTVGDFARGEEHHHVVVIQDITERHAVEQMKRDFVSTVSHELRTPLASLRFSLGLLGRGDLGPLSSEAQEAVAIAERNTIRLIGMINDLLDLDRLESSNLTMHVATVRVQDVFDRALEATGDFARQLQVQLVAVRSDAEVDGDEDRLVQVVVNLLSNAVKFSPPGSTVRLEADREPEGVRIRVRDQGPGIAPEHYAAIFDRFRQIESTETRQKGGSGLGLSICRAIIEQHRGSIGLESAIGRGSTFWVRLPTGPMPGG